MGMVKLFCQVDVIPGWSSDPAELKGNFTTEECQGFPFRVEVSESLKSRIPRVQNIHNYTGNLATLLNAAMNIVLLLFVPNGKSHIYVHFALAEHKEQYTLSPEMDFYGDKLMWY